MKKIKYRQKDNNGIEKKKLMDPKLQKIKLLGLQNDYIRNLFNGNYYLARTNMIADQLNSGRIEEKIDGHVKTKELLMGEFCLMKMQAITAMRNAYHMKQDLIKEHGMTETEIKKVEEDYVKGQIVREIYEPTGQPGKAGFVEEK